MTTATQKQLDYAADLIAIYNNSQIAITRNPAANDAINALLVDRLRSVVTDGEREHVSRLIDAVKSRNIKAMMSVAGIGQDELADCLKSAGVA